MYFFPSSSVLIFVFVKGGNKLAYIFMNTKKNLLRGNGYFRNLFKQTEIYVH